MSQLQKNHSIGYWFQQAFMVFLYVVPALLLAMYDFAFVTYDSEPDYVASAFHIVEYGIPFSSHHPGTITQYLVSLPLLLTLYFELPFDITIILMRMTVLSVLALLIRASINTMGVINKEVKFFSYSLVWFFIFLYPSTSVLFKYISAEILLFGFSFFLCALWYKYFLTERGLALIGIVVGAGMNVKPTFIFLLIVLSSFHLLYYAYYSKLIRGIQLIFKIFAWGSIWFIVFAIPKIFQILSVMSEIVGDWYVLINKVVSMFSIWHYFAIFIIISLGIFLFNWSIKHEILSKNKSNLINVMIREGWIIALPVAVFVFYKLFYYFIHPEIDYLIGLGQWESLGIMRRNSVPLYAFLVFIIIRIVISKTLELKHYKSLLYFSVFILFFGGLITNGTASKEYMFENSRIRLFDQSLLAIKNNTESASIFVHHDNFFDSVAQFQLWTTVRYGNCNGEKLDTTLKLTYPNIDISNLLYISAFNGITGCDINKDNNNALSLYDRWLRLKISDNVVRSSICNALRGSDDQKIFLLDSRYIDWDNPDEIVNDLDLVVQSCGYKMHRNRKYFRNNDILAFDLIKA